MKNMTTKTNNEWEKEFLERFCEKDRGLRTRMKAMNNVSVADGIRRFIRDLLSSERQRLKEETEKDLKIVLDFVERWNKQDEDKKVAEAASKLEKLLEE